MDVREENAFFQAKNTDEALEQVLYHIAERSQNSQNNGDLAGAISMLLSKLLQEAKCYSNRSVP